MNDIAAAYLQPANVLGLPNVFFVGPFGARVSFASQQRRALNVVWAVDQLHNADAMKGRNVAVIGGGIAGVTAVAACLSVGAKVWLYDRQPEVLTVQEGASHRWVHPTINFWPEEDLEPTTELPFFDWSAGGSDTIVRTLRKDWTDTYLNRVEHFYRRTEVTAITCADPAGQVTVSAKNASGPFDGKYDFVIVTTGFGKETEYQYTDAKQYWDWDALNHNAKVEYGRYFVSGTGDGGLIDLFRLIHRNYDNGKFAAAVVRELDRLGLDQKVADIEKEARAKEPDVYELSSWYAPKYRALMTGLDADLEKLFDKSYRQPRSADDEVVLAGILHEPFSVAAAPIHKFILAHALARGRVTYRQGSVTDDSGELAIEAPHYYVFNPVTGRQERRFVTTTAPHAVRAREAIRKDVAIIRHGAQGAPISGFVGHLKDWADLRKRQENWAQLLRLHDKSREFFWKKSGLTWTMTSKDFVDSRHDRATAFLLETYGWVARPSLIPSTADQWQLKAQPHAKEARESSVIPPKLFGITVESVDTPRVTPLVGKH